MKLSDYVAKFLEQKKITHSYVVTGGCAVHLIDSISKRKKISYIPVQHEQSGAMAADAHARVSNNISSVIATSGPGATNLLTGICCSYYDSIPVLAITGQVPTGQLKGSSKSRQIGFQETDVVSIFKSVTKYAKLVTDPNLIRYELEKAYHIAMSGRKGPVLLDICDDIQRAVIDPKKLKKYLPPKQNEKKSLTSSEKDKLIRLIHNAKRPVLIVGAGVRLSNTINACEKLIKTLNIPFTLTWGAMDIFSHKNSLFVGSFGVTSGRAGNFAVQNSDLILTLGTRLDTHEVGSNIKTFAREAKRIVVDLDPAEQKKYKKMGFSVNLLLTMSLENFLPEINKLKLNKFNINPWLEKIKKWKTSYISCDSDSANQKKFINPYFFMQELSKGLKPNTNVITDCGSNLIWTMQGLPVKTSQRVISAWNHSPMGYALPASIGPAFFEPNKPTICISGDGGLQMNIQELATIFKHNLNIKIFVMNNHCHGIIQGTQQAWLDGKYCASDPEIGKLPDPDFSKIANAYGIPSRDVRSHSQLIKVLPNILDKKGPELINIHMEKKSQIYPKLLFGRPIEDSHPLLDRDEFNTQMIIKTI